MYRPGIVGGGDTVKSESTEEQSAEIRRSCHVIDDFIADDLIYLSL